MLELVSIKARTVLSRTRPVIPKEKTRSTGSPRRFRSFLAELGPARRETAGFTPCAPRRTHPRRKPGPKRPSAFPAWRVDVRERRRRAVCTRKVNESFQHTAHSRSNNRTIIYSQQHQQQHAAAAAAVPHRGRPATSERASYHPFDDSVPW